MPRPQEGPGGEDEEAQVEREEALAVPRSGKVLGADHVLHEHVRGKGRGSKGDDRRERVASQRQQPRRQADRRHDDERHRVETDRLAPQRLRDGVVDDAEDERSEERRRGQPDGDPEQRQSERPVALDRWGRSFHRPRDVGHGDGHVGSFRTRCRRALLWCWTTRPARTTPARQPGALPPGGGTIASGSSPERPSSQAVSEFEFHISPVASSSRPQTGVGTCPARSSSRRASAPSPLNRRGLSTASATSGIVPPGQRRTS